MSSKRRPAGMAGFTVVWIGQVVSLLGSSMTIFGLTIWMFEETGRATSLALLGMFYMIPLLLASPVAGVMVDRHSRKLLMILSDLASGLVTLAAFFLLLTGGLQVWHLYVAAFVMGTFQTFQWPAFSAAITLMLPKEQYTRANSMMELANSASNIFAPLAAGALLGVIGLSGILMIDIVTFVFAISALLVVVIPEPERTEESKAGQAGMFEEVAYGFRYILERPSLLGLQTIFLLGNFFATVGFTLLAPLILSRTDSNELIFGSVQTIGAIGGVIGGVVISTWGGFKRRVHGVLAGWMFSMFGLVIAGIGRPDPVWAAIPVWGAGLFIQSFFAPLINGSNQAIWQAKVAPDVQGRVFSIRRLIAWLVIPLAQLTSGPLADQVMEPAMREGGPLADVFGWLVGVGPGAGMSLILVFAGLLGMVAGLSGYLFPSVRDVEDILPDHDAASAHAGGVAS